MNPYNFHICIFFIFLFNFTQNPSFISAYNLNTNFDFLSFNLRNLTLLGDSHLRNGVIGLTRESSVPTSSSGTLIYNSPITFFDQESNTTASFSTNFTFSITNLNPTTSFGDGFTFFLSSNNQTLGSPGGYLGIVNSSQFTPQNKFVAVEFDTRLDSNFDDPNGNHVGLDLDSLTSINTADATSIGIELKAGVLTTAWIDYENDEQYLKVFLSYNSSKPEEPLLMVDIDLSDYLKEFKYVGFSASTEGSTEVHFINTWSFQTLGLPLESSRSSPKNSSDNSITTKPEIQVSSSKSNHTQHKWLGLALGIGGPSIFVIVLAILGLASVKKWSRIRLAKNNRGDLMNGPRQFSYKELKSATKDFHSSRIIGNGAFGTVYKAYLTDSATVSAVKRSKHSHEGKTEFLSELSIIACLRHKNLVQLQGWCIEKGELLLVYEFMSNGSLDKVLYNEQGSVIKWEHRYNIAVGLASVLTYLHQECEQQVIHRDIKAANIMLDSNFNPRLGDFGLARLMDHDKSPVSTLTAGTMGYLAPEYLQYGKATEKTDVFSYGVVVLELVCGRRPIERDEDMVNLVDWVWGLHSRGKIVEAADKILKGELKFKEEEIKKLLLMGLSCANPDYTKRPSMRRVLQILNDQAEPVIVPKVKPSFSFSTSLHLCLADLLSDDEGINSSETVFSSRVEEK